MRPNLQIPNAHDQFLPVWCLDFETYFNSKDGYSLSKKGVTTTTYVRDERFKAHGVAVVDPDGKTYWVTHDDLKEFFASIDWSQAVFAAHNTQFDAFIATEIYGVNPAYYVDTMAMSYGEWGAGVRHRLIDLCRRLGLRGKLEGELEKTDGVRDLSPEQEAALIPYALRDAEELRNAFEILYFDRRYPQNEMHLIDVTTRMYANPRIMIDRALCEAEIEEENIRIQSLLHTDLIGDAELSDASAAILREKGLAGLMRSRPAFAELLRSRGVEPPLKEKIVKKEVVPGEYTYAFAKNDPELIALADDPRVSDLVAAWTGTKSSIRKTRAQRFLEASVNGTKTFPMPLIYCGARTNRWSGRGTSLNIQNLPSGRDGRGSRLRQSMRAPKGFRILAADLAQGELRCSAWLAGEEQLLESLRTGGDPYSETASEVYGVNVVKDGENGHLRHVGKEAELSLGFGVGALKFYNTIQTKYGRQVGSFTMEDAQRVVDFYRRKRVNIVGVWNDLREIIPQMAAKMPGFNYKIFRVNHDSVVMPSTLMMHYRNLHWHYDRETRQGNFIYQHGQDWTRIYAAKMYENLIQSMQRDVLALHIVEISKEFQVLSTVHDEILVLVPEKEADEATDYCINVMRQAPSWAPDLPLDAEGKHADYYAK